MHQANSSREVRKQTFQHLRVDGYIACGLDHAYLAHDAVSCEGANARY